MVSAMEARKLSDSANSNKWVKELEEIEKKIKESFEVGRYKVFVDKKLENKTVVKLEEAGYQVTYDEPKDKWDYFGRTTISW